MSEKRRIVCSRCGVELENKRVGLEYNGHKLQSDLPCCPGCGQCYVSFDLAKGRLREVEMEMEDK
jgi:hypothetical protein